MEKLLEYKKAFFFGIKLVLLLIALFLPVSLFSFLGYGLYCGISKTPVLSNRELNIELILSFKDPTKINEEIRDKIKSNKNLVKMGNPEGGFYYASVNRGLRNRAETEEFENKFNSVVNGDEFQTINVNSSGLRIETLNRIPTLFPNTELYLWSPQYAWDGRVIDEGLSVAGMWVMCIVIFVLVVVGFACYFPIVKAFINLFKYKKVF